MNSSGAQQLSSTHNYSQNFKSSLQKRINKTQNMISIRRKTVYKFSFLELNFKSESKKLTRLASVQPMLISLQANLYQHHIGLDLVKENEKKLNRIKTGLI